MTTSKSNTSWNHQQPYTKKNDSSSCQIFVQGFSVPNTDHPITSTESNKQLHVNLTSG